MKQVDRRFAVRVGDNPEDCLSEILAEPLDDWRLSLQSVYQKSYRHKETFSIAKSFLFYLPTVRQNSPVADDQWSPLQLQSGS